MPALNPAQLEQFHTQGYVVVEDLIDTERVIAPVIAEYEGVLDRLADELHADGTIASAYEDLPFQERLTRVYHESGKVHAQYFDFSLPQGNVQPDTPFWAGPAVFNTLIDEDLLDAVESIVGPEIYSNPVQHVRLKPPEHLTPKNPDTGLPQLGVTPWHQDNGVVLPEADESEILTVWFSLTDALVEHGVLSGGVHYQGQAGVVAHDVDHGAQALFFLDPGQANHRLAELGTQLSFGGGDSPRQVDSLAARTQLREGAPLIRIGKCDDVGPGNLQLL